MSRRHPSGAGEDSSDKRLNDLAVLMAMTPGAGGAYSAARTPNGNQTSRPPSTTDGSVAPNSTAAADATAAMLLTNAGARRFAPDPPGSHAVEDNSKKPAPSASLPSTAMASSSKKNASVVAEIMDGKKRAVAIFDPSPKPEDSGHPMDGQVPPRANKKARQTRSWDEFFACLVSFKAAYGHCNIPMDYPNDPELGLWVREQHTQGFLSAEQKYKLEMIGFFVPNRTYPLHLQGLAAINSFPAFAALGANVPVLHSFPPQQQQGGLPGGSIFAALDLYKQQQERTYAAAAASQQVAASNRFGTMSHTQSMLGAGVAGTTGGESNSSEEEQWNYMYQKLMAHHNVYGNCDALASATHDPALRLWMLQQKNLYRSGAMTEDRIAKLKSVKFISDGSTSTDAKKEAAIDKDDRKSVASQDSDDAKRRVRSFEENFQALLDYKKQHGNVDVPQKYDKDRKLGIWVKNVRQHPIRHTEEQRAKLDSIGFKWRKLQLDDQWNEAFQQLIEYRDKYGDCNVPSRWKTSPALARWVHTQRTMYRRNKLLEERKERLEEAGFVWDCNAMRDDEAFHENYEKLVAFKKSRGHCSIPNKYRRDRPLGRWAAKMRDLYVTGQLDVDRTKALNDIGFAWKLESSLTDNDISINGGDGDGDDDDQTQSDNEGDEPKSSVGISFLNHQQQKNQGQGHETTGMDTFKVTR